MPVIDNPAVVRFSNEQVRTLSSQLIAAYWQTKQFNENYVSANIGSLIDSAGAGNVIDDKSDVDGRTPLVGGDVYNLVTAALAFVAFVEGGAVPTLDRSDVLTKPASNGG